MGQARLGCKSGVRWVGEHGRGLRHTPDPIVAGFDWGQESKGANGVSGGMQNPKNNKGQARILSKAISTDKELK